jgi:hypothetical protein
LLGKLGKGLKIGSYALAAYNTFKDYESLTESGHDPGEAAAGAGSKGLASVAYTGGPVGMAINLVNAGLQLAGAPQKVSDVTSVAADATPASAAAQGVGQAGQLVYNLAKGDMKAIDKQVDEMREGKAGAVWQGWSQLTELTVQLASGKDAEQALLQVGSKGQDTAVARLGAKLGDEAYQFIEKDLPEATEFAKKDLARAEAAVKEEISAVKKDFAEAREFVKKDWEQAKETTKEYLGAGVKKLKFWE